MIPFERRVQLLKLLEAQKTLSVRELSTRLFVSEASVRRDIEELEAQGQVKRIWGGVMLASAPNVVVPIDLRDGEHSAVKEALAQRAAALISDGDSIIMDGSSTVRRIVKHLDGKKNLRIITNNLRIFHDCITPDVQLYCTGGLYFPKNQIFIGTAAESYLRTISADILFFSSQGLSEDGEISDTSEEETALRRVMLQRARKKVFLCDSSKLGVRKGFTLCRKEEVSEIICNMPLPWESVLL